MKNEDQWNDRFGDVIENNGTSLYETYGDDLEKVKAADPLSVWTVIETENENQYLRPGFHLVDRIGFVLSENPITEQELQSGEWDSVLWLDRAEFESDTTDGDDFNDDSSFRP
jgi:hypothetical protein